MIKSALANNLSGNRSNHALCKAIWNQRSNHVEVGYFARALGLKAEQRLTKRARNDRFIVCNIFSKVAGTFIRISKFECE